MKIRAIKNPPGFTLIELLVVIVIIAVLAGLIFPVFAKVKTRGIETRTTSNLKQVATAMASYIAEHDGTLPGPLSLEQYPVFDDSATYKGSLPRLLAPYLSMSKKDPADADKKGTAKEGDIFACPGATGPNLDEVAGYIMNLEKVPDYDQPAWGELGGDKQPLKMAALTAWRDTSSTAVSKDSMVTLARKWAMRHTDQKDLKNAGITAEWVEKLPKEPIFDDHYQALYFDWHVGIYKASETTKNGQPPPDTDED